MRQRVGSDFWLMLDCWMALDLNYATRLATKAWEQSGLKWIEEALSPDDYWGYRDLKKAVPQGMSSEILPRPNNSTTTSSNKIRWVVVRPITVSPFRRQKPQRR